jgi:cytochrome c biogenesis protein
VSTTTEPPVQAEAPDPAELSTQPAPVQPGRRGDLLSTVRRGWRRLTSMRTALVLLFLLALAAIPGSLLPQRPLNQSKVDRYFSNHPSLAPLLDRLGFFDVFASPWFGAIYLLLFISLIGCLVPRIRLHARALRTPPPRAPRNLDRLPQSMTLTVDGSPGDAASRVPDALGRWRVVTRDEPDGAVAASAEKGYLRETGNLIFHVALTVLLAGIALGRIWGYQGTVLVEEGSGFCNSVALYDSFHAGRGVSDDSLAPFCVDRLNKFTATYDPDGTPSEFRADITYSTVVNGSERRYPLEVNKPLRIEGARIYLVSHGFSPRFTVRTPSGQEFRDVSAPFLPQDGQLLSEGVLKLPDARPSQLGIAGLFAPTAVTGPDRVMRSASASPDAPAVAIFVYEGDLGVDSGRPQSVYSLDQNQIDRGVLKKVASATMIPGRSLRLNDGTVVTFNGYREWATIQVSHDPGQPVVLGAAAFIVIGLLLSLSVRRRRIWLRFTPARDTARDDWGADSRHTLVAVGGLARSNAGNFTTEFARLTEHLTEGAQRATRED